MSYVFYKILHFSALFTMILSLGAVASHCLQGGTKKNFKNRKLMGILHGFGALLSLVAGFGMMAKQHYSFSTDLWLWGKLIIWFILGFYPLFFYRQKLPAKALLGIMLSLFFVAIYIVVIKPF